PELLREELALIHAASGAAGVMAFWQQVAPAHPNVRLDQQVPCDRPGAIGAPGPDCFEVVQTSGTDTVVMALRPATLPLFLGICVSAFMAIWLSRWLTQPIRAVSQGLRSLAVGRLETRMQGRLRTTNQEIQDLGRDFDHAAARLQALSDGRSRLFHDISHEIRSPLARLRAAVGLIEKTPARGVALAGRMEGDIARLDHLVDEILTLARFEKSERINSFQTFDLLDIVENIITDAKFEGRARGIDVRYAGADVLELQGDPELLHRACENVIRNALNHSPPGGTVIVTGCRSTEAMTLAVADEGAGVPETDLDTIFSPFVRLNAQADSVGVGLGLAISYGAIKAHGGAITASNIDSGGFQITITIPVDDRSMK
ncbi:MAG: HAMP domain-containing histidine kinase, partial [Alphaproteobacteria bacterium]|nr:HAMP domain-containing histidine kinase [Alphaproteobacteria bacterium]